MGKANFYGIPRKERVVYPPRRRQRSAGEANAEYRGAPGASEPRPAYHSAPQFRRNRRYWLRRLGRDST